MSFHSLNKMINQAFDFKRYVANRHKSIAKSPLSQESHQALEAPCDLMRTENFCNKQKLKVN